MKLAGDFAFSISAGWRRIILHAAVARLPAVRRRTQASRSLEITMNRRKKTKRDPSTETRHDSLPASRQADPQSSVSIDREQQTESAPGKSGYPGSAMRALITIWLPFHLFALAVSFTAVVEPSSLQVRFQSLLRPYLEITHFDAGGAPVYLAHGQSDEQAHRLEFSRSDINNNEAADSQQAWTAFDFEGLPGLARGDRRGRLLSTAATLAENEQASLVAELLWPFVKSDESIRAIRIVRLPTELHEDLPPPYVARVIRRGDELSLVQLQSGRLSATAQPAETNLSGQGQNGVQQSE